MAALLLAAAVGVAGFDMGRLARVDTLVADGIRARQLPGAVVLVGREDTVAYVKAYGNRALVPAPEPMTTDTVFDLASLTKVVATTTSVMILIEEGRLRLADPVAAFVPGFERYGKGGITIRHLLTHTSGLRPDIDLSDPWSGYETAIARAVEEVPTSPPGERFVYSDINFFLLGEVVARVSGQGLARFSRERIFEPLGMRDTGFNPAASLLPRIAPTEACAGPDCRAGEMLRGVVHDPTARRMGGVAGHAGLFGTAGDLSRFCRMLLHGGQLGTTRILSPLGVAKMTSPATPPGARDTRAFGWDLDSRFASNSGDLLPVGSFGHTGFTGTSLWIDPLTGVYVVFLSNRLHPDGKGDVTPLRAKVATAVAAALVDPGPRVARREADFARQDFGAASRPTPPRREAVVLTGLDVLRQEGFARLHGKKLGLLTTDQTSARSGAPAMSLLRAAPGIELVSVGPGLDGIDTLVVDLPGGGSRLDDSATAIARTLTEAAKRRVSVVVLDRPNPIDGFQIEGPAGRAIMPIRHGLTIGEMARALNAENRIGAELTVVPMKDWRRDHWFDETGLPWADPSAEVRSQAAALLHPGLGALEGTNVSVGRGTDRAYEQVGAPWIDGVRLAETLNARGLPGVRFYPVRFTPAAAPHAGVPCAGVGLSITDRAALRPVRLGLDIAAALHRLSAGRYETTGAEELAGSKEALARLEADDDPARIAAGWAADEARWRLRRAPYLLYP
jgi:CubicO group peptidase (beta-lactamase class C family)